MTQDDEALLLRLKEHDVDFVIIDGICSTLHGVSILTFDLDICCSFEISNLRRIEKALKDLHPRHRLSSDKLPLELTDELCGSLKNLYLKTDWGTLDCLGEVAGLGSFENVLRHSETRRIYNSEFRLLTLDALITAKEAAGREKDLAAVRQLRAIKERNEQRNN